MALKIRLSRGGAKKRPFYRVVVADVRSPRDGRYIEKLGTFNPLLAKDSGERFKVDLERVQYWLSKGAKPTDKVARFLSENDLYKWERGNNPNKGKPGLKAQERLEEQAQKEAEAKEAAEAAAAAEAEAAAAPAEEAPAEEAPAEEEKSEE
ncbi:MAG: 30S ribosomal protein S16 [Alphaproteobacteria bacterium]|nr:MAG: 30S ribosomal protein S16 [Alphaproteobacteria bacterium]